MYDQYTSKIRGISFREFNKFDTFIKISACESFRLCRILSRDLIRGVREWISTFPFFP